MSIKIISYNVNGIRAAIKKGLINWIKNENPDIICIQETKASKEQVDISELTEAGYSDYWYSASKKGYSGVAVFTKIVPHCVEYGLKTELYDIEGRALRLDFPNFSLLNCYFPSGTSGETRQAFKMQFLEHFQEYVKKLLKEKENLIITGDYNICHTEIDIHNPIANKNTTGFLPEEREWLSQFLQNGFLDSFRMFNKEPQHYTWWSYRAGARARNLGWRIDYNLVSNAMADKVVNAKILNTAVHSDHCPTFIEIE